MTLISERHARRSLTITAVLCAAGVLMLSIAPPTEGGWRGWMLPGCAVPLVLIAIWSALGATSWLIRWPTAAAAFWLVARPLHSDDPRLGVWKGELTWNHLPHALLTFTCLCLARECGLRIAPAATETASRVAKHFELRRIFAWVFGAAAISLAWKHLLDAGVGWEQPVGVENIVGWPGALSWSMALVDLLTLRVVLQLPQLRWRQLGWAVVILSLQTVVWHVTTQYVMRREGSWPSWSRDFGFACFFDTFYLLPLLAVLLLTRAAGYRLVWTGSGQK
ncbi:MAG TPA: hypothetical protein VG826_14700 [Pirellulales bacterium]|nr:hypothetical protein [Pirellulales bacterium]